MAPRTVDTAGKRFRLPKGWTYGAGSHVQAPISWWGDYVISHRAGQHVCSYRPPGSHFHVGQAATAAQAFALAVEHDKRRKAKG